MKKITTILATVALLTSCYKAEFYTTDHPDQGEVSLDVEIPTTSDGTDYTGTMTLVFDGVEYNITPGESFDLPDLLDPGTYTYYIYSDHTEDDDATATVTYDQSAGTLIASVTTDSEGNVDPNPNEIYFSAETLEVSKDSAEVLSSETSVLGRDLEFELALDGDAASRLESFSAMLNGVAQQWDCISDTPYGTSASVLSSLSITTTTSSNVSRSGSDTYYLKGTIHLLGIVTDDTQTLILELGYEGDHPDTHTYTSDVSDTLSDFNDDKSSAMTLTNTVETPTATNPSGSIGEWKTTEYQVEAK